MAEKLEINTRDFRIHIPFVVYLIAFEKGEELTTKLSLKNLAPTPSGGIRKDCKARGCTGQQKKFLILQFLLVLLRG